LKLPELHYKFQLFRQDEIKITKFWEIAKKAFHSNFKPFSYFFNGIRVVFALFPKKNLIGFKNCRRIQKNLKLEDTVLRGTHTCILRSLNQFLLAQLEIFDLKKKTEFLFQENKKPTSMFKS
jgi:hypothetical protein